jgi:hypothetical protein
VWPDIPGALPQSPTALTTCGIKAGTRTPLHVAKGAIANSAEVIPNIMPTWIELGRDNARGLKPSLGGCFQKTWIHLHEPLIFARVGGSRQRTCDQR